MSNLLYELRLASRSLRASPAFAILGIVTLALGIGANTAIFSAINGVFLRPLPYRNADRILAVEQRAVKLDGLDNGTSVTEVNAFREQTTSTASTGEYHSMTFTMYGQGEPTRVATGVVSASFFDDLGVTPLLGRSFRAGEDAIGAPPNAVLTYKFWQSQFGGDSKVIGRTFTMNDRVHTIIGVLPPLPDYPNANDIYVPAGSCPFRSAPRMMSDPAMRMVNMYVRLKPGVTTERALADLQLVSSRLHAQYPQAYPPALGLTLRVEGLHDQLTQDARPTLFALLAMTAFLLLIACANVANLTLARQIRRSREMAVRVALGARRGQLLRQLSIESVLLSLAGGVAGLLLAEASMGLLRQLVARFTPRSSDIHIDGVVLAFTLVVSVATGLIFGMLPAIPERQHLSGALRDGGASGGTSRGRLRAGLVVAQVAVACVLLIASGLLARTLVNLRRVDPGYDASRVVTGLVTLNWTQYTNNDKINTFTDGVVRELRGQPGVLSVGVATGLPLDGQPANQNILTIDEPGTSGRRTVSAEATQVGADYFRTIGAGLVAGRYLSEVDRRVPSIVVNQTAARSFWPGANPIGQRVSIDSGAHWYTVVGVVRDVRQHDLTSAVAPIIYAQFFQYPAGVIRVFVQSGVPPGTAEALMHSAVQRVDPLQPLTDVRTLESMRTGTLASPQLTTTLSLAFSLVALLLTAAGLTGVMAFSVSQRTRELGIRLALGAERTRVLLMVMREGMIWVGTGLAIGVLGAVVVSRSLGSLLFGVKATDATTYALVIASVVLVTLVACLVPARRATQVDPLTAIRTT